MRKFSIVLKIVLTVCVFVSGFGEIRGGDAQEEYKKKGMPCSEIGIVTNFTDNGIFLISPDFNMLSGPYLKGELGEGNSLLNTAVIPGKNTALITGKNTYEVFFIQLPHRYGAPPVKLDSINIGYNAEEISVTPDGTFALINYTGGEPYIAVIDLEARALRSIFEVPIKMNISGIKIAADDRTVIAADHTNGKIQILELDGDGNLTYSSAIDLSFQPRSLAVSPDGKNVVVVNPSEGLPAFLRIDSPGKVEQLEENIPCRIFHGKSAKFSSDGAKVYYLTNDGSEANIHTLEVQSSGLVLQYGGSIYVSPQNADAEQEFDTITVESTGRYAYVWCKAFPDDNAGRDHKPAGIAVIDLYTQKRINIPGRIKNPVDITFGCRGAQPQHSKPTASDQPPLGSIETPANGTTVTGSIAVTGWALDDVGLESVKIYRQQGYSLVYIGDAQFIEGARPDVAAAFPHYPNNTKAGWGYMMLTNFLPNGGNGTFKIHAIAKDTTGHEVTLGIKTIYCDNAHATKPFGAIDSPQPGETISGANYRITGWALTPPPNKIPENGTTIDVRIDGKYIGNVTYNIYRSDIETFFPGYANNKGAHGYLEFDTTEYDNGVHTIEWVVKDNAENTDGIGSRFFSIQNDAANDSVTLYSNPGDSRLALIKDPDGREILFLGEKDEDGLPKSLSQMVADSEDLDPDKRATTWFDDKGRPTKSILDGGGSLTYEWLEDYVIITATSTDGTETETQFVPLDQATRELWQNSNTEQTKHTASQKPSNESKTENRVVKSEIHVKCGGEYLSGIQLTGRTKFTAGPNVPLAFTKDSQRDGVFHYNLPLASKIFPPDVDDFVTKLDTAIERSVKVSKFIRNVGCAFFLKKRVIPPCLVLIISHEMIDILDKMSDLPILVKDFFENGPVFVEVTAINQNFDKETTTFFFPNTPSIKAKVFDLGGDKNFCGTDIRGTWRLNFKWTGYSQGSASITFKGNDKYYGRFSTSDGYSGNYRVNGKKVRFNFDLGTVYWGRITSDKKMSGEMISYRNVPGTWNASRSSSKLTPIETNDKVSVIGPR
jgi:DNA-binding beta-propeller fold protein YncE